jgi:hypothetical protein
VTGHIQSQSQAFGAALARLAAERATGALHGHCAAVYLSEGVVVHAESPWAPDMGARLTACGRLSVADWSKAVAVAGPDRRVGSHLVEDGRLTRGELELCHLGALFDAAYFALLPDPGPDRLRFLPDVTHWLGPVRPVPAEVLRREACRRRALLDRVWPWPAVDVSPVVPRPGGSAYSGPGTGPTPSQRTVLESADGTRTPGEIAWRLGRSAFNTVLDVRRLAAAGLIDTPRQPAGGGHRPLPARPGGEDPDPDPDVSLLIRIRAALEARL